MMNNTWRQSTTLNHALQFMITKFGTVALAPGSSLKSENTLSRMKRLLRKFAMTRQCMLHFLTNLQSYLMFEVLESGWKDLVQKLQGATTLDEVITSHDEYLNDILEKSLVGEALLEDAGVEGSGSELPKQLRLVLSAAFRFCKMHDNIFSEGVETIQKATEKRRGAQKRSAHGEWGFDQFDADVEGLNFYSLADEASLVEVESISEEFDMSLRTLLSMLNDRINGNSVRDVDVSSPSLMRPTQTQSSDQANASKNDALRFLTFRLDFSAFYGL
jgi:gamma-tubulin complex component 3